MAPTLSVGNGFKSKALISNTQQVILTRVLITYPTGYVGDTNKMMLWYQVGINIGIAKCDTMSYIVYLIQVYKYFTNVRGWRDLDAYTILVQMYLQMLVFRLM